MYILRVFIFLLFSFIYLYSLEFENIEFESLDENNAVLKAEKKDKFYEYVLKYKFGKYGYTDDEPYITDIFDKENEDKQDITFTNNLYLYDNIWVDLNVDYHDSLEKNKSDSGVSYSENKIIQQQSFAKLYFKPNSIITTNLTFENKNEDSDFDINNNTYNNFTLNKESKLSFDIGVDLDLIDIYTKFYQANNNFNKFYKDMNSDYIENTNNLTRGVELTFKKDFGKSLSVSTTLFRENNGYDYLYKESSSNTRKRIGSLSQGLKLSIEKSLLDHLKLITSARISDNEITDSNKKELIGKRSKYKAGKQLDVSLEYEVKEMKLFSKFTHLSSRYADEENTNMLDAYTIGSVGSTFYTKINNEDVKVDFNINNVFDKEYYVDSDTKGDSRSYFFNMIMRF